MITQILLQQTIIMFLLMMLGLLLSRRGMITEQGSRDLSNVLLYAVIPCVILRSYMSEFSMDKLRAMGISAVIAVIAFIASIGVAYLTCGTRHRIENFAVPRSATPASSAFRLSQLYSARRRRSTLSHTARLSICCSGRTVLLLYQAKRKPSI